jgi:hypothetical protein
MREPLYPSDDLSQRSPTTQNGSDSTKHDSGVSLKLWFPDSPEQMPHGSKLWSANPGPNM